MRDSREAACANDAPDLDADSADEILASAQLEIAKPNGEPSVVETSQLGDDVGFRPALRGRRVRELRSASRTLDATEVVQQRVVERVGKLVRWQRRAGPLGERCQLRERSALRRMCATRIHHARGNPTVTAAAPTS